MDPSVVIICLLCYVLLAGSILVIALSLNSQGFRNWSRRRQEQKAEQRRLAQTRAAERQRVAQERAAEKRRTEEEKRRLAEERITEKRRVEEEKRRLAAERVAEERRREEEQRRLAEERAAEHRHLQQEREARIRFLSDPANFQNLSDVELKELGEILLPKIQAVVRSAGMGLASVVLDHNGIVAKAKKEFRAPRMIVSQYEQRRTSRGKIVQGRKKKDSEIIGEYLNYHVATLLLANGNKILGSAYQIHPFFTKLFISCSTGLMNEYGNYEPSCFLSVVLERDLLLKLNLANLSPIDALRKFPHRLGQTPDGRLIAIEPLDVKPKQTIDQTNTVSLNDLKSMGPYDFEKFVGSLLNEMRFQTVVTKPSQDGGVDVIAEMNQPLLRGRVLVQCKRYQGTVGVPVIRELYGSVVHESAMKGIVITTSNFTLEARKFAEGKPIELVDGKTLDDLIRRHFGGQASQGESNYRTSSEAGLEIVLMNVGKQKIPVIKIVRELHGGALGLAEAKRLVESAPITLKREVSTREAQEIKRQLEAVGATVEIK